MSNLNQLGSYCECLSSISDIYALAQSRKTDTRTALCESESCVATCVRFHESRENVAWENFKLSPSWSSFSRFMSQKRILSKTRTLLLQIRHEIDIVEDNSLRQSILRNLATYVSSK